MTSKKYASILSIFCLLLASGAALWVCPKPIAAGATPIECPLSLEQLQHGKYTIYQEYDEGDLTLQQARACLMATRNAPRLEDKVPAHVEGEMLVKFAPDLDAAEMAAAHGFRVIENLPHGWQRISTASESVDLQALEQMEGVLAVEPNYIYRTTATPTDPLYEQQWAQPWIQAEDAWTVVTATESITVAVIDTGCGGVDPHPDLQVDWGWNTIADDGNYADDNGHGTHAAGVIAAIGNNGVGVAGLSWGGSSLICIKALDYSGSGSTADLAEAVDVARQQGAKIINASWSGPYSQIVADAVEALQDSGGLFVASRGNTFTNEEAYPALLPGVVSVGATDQNDRLASFSSWGDVTLVAPGVAILSTYMSSIYVPTYESMSGTSMAAPYVTALAALVWAQHSDWTAAQVDQQLRVTADDLGVSGPDEFFGYGRINAARALGLPGKPVITASDVRPQWLPHSGGVVTASMTIYTATAASLVVTNTIPPVAQAGDRYTATVSLPANSTGSDQVWSLTVVATSTVGLTRSVTLPSVTVFAEANEGQLQFLGELSSWHQQTDDEEWGVWANGLSMLGAADYYLGEVRVEFQLENGIWGPENYRDSPAGSGNGTVSVGLKDLTGDGHLDLVNFNRFNGIHMWAGIWPPDSAGNVFATAPAVISSSASPDDGKLADMNGDALPDIVWVESARVQYVLSLGGGAFGPVQTVNVSDIMLADVVEVAQGASGLEIVIFDHFNDIFVLRGPNFSQRIQLSSCGFRDLAVGDLNGDGRYDLVVPCAGSQHSFDYFIQQADDTFVRSNAAGSDGNWHYADVLIIGQQQHVCISDIQMHRLFDIPFVDGAPQLPPDEIASDVLPGNLEYADLNLDGLDDLIGGLAGYVSPYGAPIKLWQQTPSSPPDTPPSAVTLASFDALWQEGSVLVTWETALEVDSVGFNLYRSESSDGPYTRLNETLIPSQAPGSVSGAIYSWRDSDVQAGITYYYKLEDIEIGGASTLHGPVSASVQIPTMISLISVQAQGSTHMAAAMGVGIVVVLAALASRQAKRSKK